jgi:hypothetical protein
LHNTLVHTCAHDDLGVVREALALFKTLVHRFRGVSELSIGIEILFADIVLPVLDSLNAAFERKRVVIETIRDICVDADTVMSLFIHHDASFVGGGGEASAGAHASALEERGALAEVERSVARAEGGGAAAGGGASSEAPVAEADAFVLPEMQGLFEKIVHALERVTKQGVFGIGGGKMGSTEKQRGQQEALRIAALGGLVAILDSLVHFTNTQSAAGLLCISFFVCFILLFAQLFFCLLGNV